MCLRSKVQTWQIAGFNCYPPWNYPLAWFLWIQQYCACYQDLTQYTGGRSKEIPKVNQFFHVTSSHGVLITCIQLTGIYCIIPSAFIQQSHQFLSSRIKYQTFVWRHIITYTPKAWLQPVYLSLSIHQISFSRKGNFILHGADEFWNITWMIQVRLFWSSGPGWFGARLPAVCGWRAHAFGIPYTGLDGFKPHTAWPSRGSSDKNYALHCTPATAGHWWVVF